MFTRKLFNWYRSNRHNWFTSDHLIESEGLDEFEKTYSPSKFHCELANNTIPQFKFRSNEDPYKWQENATKKLKELLGWITPQTTELDVRTVWIRENSLGRFKKIVISSERQTWMPAYVCFPKDGFNGSWLICMQGHNTGMHNSIGVDQNSEKFRWIPHGERDYALWGLGHGYAVLCLEQRALGERVEKTLQSVAHHPCQDAAMRSLILGRTLMGERLYDVGIGLDFIENYQTLNGQIGVVGNSLGGTLSIYSTALFPNISFCIASSCFASFDTTLLSRYHCTDLYIPNIRTYFEFGDIAGLASPKKMLILQAVNDPIFPLVGLRNAYKTTKTIYKSMGCADHIRLEIAQRGHRFYNELATIGKNSLRF